MNSKYSHSSWLVQLVFILVSRHQAVVSVSGSLVMARYLTVCFSVKVLRSLIEDGGTTIDNPKNRDLSRHIYDLVWQAVRDKVNIRNLRI